MATRGKPATPKKGRDKEFVHCIYHDTSKDNQKRGITSDNFYLAPKTSKWQYGNKGVIPICKECLKKIYQDYYHQTQDTRYSVYNTCRKADIAYIDTAYSGAVSSAKGRWTNVWGQYMRIYVSIGVKKDSHIKCFDNSDPVDSMVNNTVNIKTGKVALNHDDNVVKKDVIRMINYDPFYGFNEGDQKFLYNDMLGYLNEDILEDNYKLSQAIQIVNNNNQIRKYNELVGQYSQDPTAIVANLDALKQLNDLMYKIVQNNDKIAKENGFSEKSKGNNKGNKSALSYMMKELRELGFEDAEEDYYDQQKAHGMSLVADISHKSLLEQLQLDENDYNEIVKYQKELIKELQSKVEDLQEKNRQLHEQLSS